MGLVARSALVLALIAGTASSGCVTDPTPPFAPAPDIDGGPDDIGIAPGGPTYYGQVDDILAAHCWRCHSSTSGISGIVLDSYDSAVGMMGLTAQALVLQASHHQMPPYFADATECAPLLDHGLRPTEFEIAVLEHWVLRGNQEGDDVETHPTAPVVAHLPETSPSVTLPLYWTPPSSRSSPPSERCFVVDTGIASGAVLTAYEIVPENTTIVYDAVIYQPNDATEADRAEALSGPDGYDCFTGVGVGVGATPIGSWTAGSGRVDFPSYVPTSVDAGAPVQTGITIHDSRLIFRVHYVYRFSVHPDAGPVDVGPDTGVDAGPDAGTDDSGIDAAVLPRNVFAETTTFRWLIGTAQALDVVRVDVPVSLQMGQMPMTVSGDGTAVATATRVLGALPQMGSFGTDVTLSRAPLSVPADDAGVAAADCVMRVRPWNLAWEQSYFLSGGFDLAAGERPHLDCTYDTRGAIGPVMGGEDPHRPPDAGTILLDGGDGAVVVEHPDAGVPPMAPDEVCRAWLYTVTP